MRGAQAGPDLWRRGLQGTYPGVWLRPSVQGPWWTWPAWEAVGSSSGNCSGESQLGEGLEEEIVRREGATHPSCLGVHARTLGVGVEMGICLSPGQYECGRPLSPMAEAGGDMGGLTHCVSQGAPQSWGSAPQTAPARGPHPGMKVNHLRPSS